MILKSIKHLIFRRKRNVDLDVFVGCVDKADDIDKLKHLLTNAMLNEVGLKLVDDIGQTVPRGVWLNRLQKNRKALAEEAGYLIGLL